MKKKEYSLLIEKIEIMMINQLKCDAEEYKKSLIYYKKANRFKNTTKYDDKLLELPE